jgi:hypothetical protein
MPEFPRLKTGAVTQYPTSREMRFSNTRMQFINGSEQRYRTSAGALKRWIITLTLLDEHEIHELERFFNECQGAFGTFSFVDPADDVEYSDCSLSQDNFVTIGDAETRNRATLIISQNR